MLQKKAHGIDISSFRIERQAARLSIPKELKQPSNAYGIKATVSIFLPLLAMMAAAPLAWLYLSSWAVIPVWVVMGVYIYKLTIVMHECAHKTLFKNQNMNRKTGALCSLFLLSDFKTFRQQHWLHHQNYGNDVDPQGRDYLHLGTVSCAALLWHLLRPLLGYNLFKLGQFTPETPHGPQTKQNKLRSLCSYAALHIPLLAVITMGGELWWLAFMYPSAAASMGLFLSQIRGFCEHIAAPNEKSETFVRTHLPNLLDRFFFYTLNFNYHVEHHLYPHIPCCHLPATYEMTKNTIHTDKTVSRSIFSTISNRYKEAKVYGAG